MKQYTGTKTIKAMPMAKSEAEQKLNRTIDCKESEGYFVEYKDGYKSWCPKSVFEETYKPSLEAIDLGLPSGRKWANMNLGATSPEDPGLYYNWGATEGHADGSDDDFYWSTYDDTPAAKIKTDLPLEHDAAHALLGGDWHMPTKEDFKELCDNCTSEWTTRNGMKGRLFTSKTNGNSIFFPAAGGYVGTSLYDRGTNGCYWSASRYDSSNAYYLDFYSGYVYPQSNSSRYLGFSVRAVQ